MRVGLAGLVIAASLVTGSAGVERPAAQGGTASQVPQLCSDARRAIVWYRGRTWDWQARHDVPRTATGHAERSPSCRYAAWSAALWRDRARAARERYRAWFRRTYEKWRCVHEREAAWNDQHPPHYGGLQFDDDFQHTYGPRFVGRWGDAGNWPVYAQLLAAERAYRGYAGYGGRGFTPWPNTARMCGLL